MVNQVSDGQAQSVGADASSTEVDEQHLYDLCKAIYKTFPHFRSVLMALLLRHRLRKVLKIYEELSGYVPTLTKELISELIEIPMLAHKKTSFKDLAIAVMTRPVVVKATSQKGSSKEEQTLSLISLQAARAWWDTRHPKQPSQPIP